MGVWPVCSTALGDFDPRRSDLDVGAIATERLPEAELAKARWPAPTVAAKDKP